MDKPKQILIVESDGDLAQTALTALEENQLADFVILAHDGEEALDYLYRLWVFETRHESNPDIVLLKRWLPKVDGLKVLRQIRSNERLDTIPVVMLASSRDQSDLEERYNMGVSAYVIKPVDFHRFFEMMMQLSLFWGDINEPVPISEKPVAIA